MEWYMYLLRQFDLPVHWASDQPLPHTNSDITKQGSTKIVDAGNCKQFVDLCS